MKAILMSIKPKWVEKIASGEKTVEVRKTVPKCGAPFKVYMYMTRFKWIMNALRKIGLTALAEKLEQGFGKVVGEFVCDNIRPFEVQSPAYWYMMNKAILEQACLTKEELHDYIGAGKLAYGLHISDLKIYDKPKELSEFNTLCKMPKEVQCEDCPYCDWNAIRNTCFARKITRPPQSWCYVEEL